MAGGGLGEIPRRGLGAQGGVGVTWKAQDPGPMLIFRQHTLPGWGAGLEGLSSSVEITNP